MWWGALLIATDTSTSNVKGSIGSALVIGGRSGKKLHWWVITIEIVNRLKSYRVYLRLLVMILFFHW